MSMQFILMKVKPLKKGAVVIIGQMHTDKVVVILVRF